MRKADKLMKLTNQKKELYEEICDLDMEVAKKKDQYRKLILEIKKLEDNYTSNIEVH